MSNTKNDQSKRILKVIKKLAKADKTALNNELTDQLKSRFINTLNSLKPSLSDSSAEEVKIEHALLEKSISSISKMKMNFEEVGTMDVKKLIKEHITPLLDDATKKKVDFAFKAAEKETVGDFLFTESKLIDNPIVLGMMRKVQLTEVKRILKLKKPIADKLIAKDLDWENVSIADFGDLGITDNERGELLGIAGFARLTGSDFELIAALKKAKKTSPLDVIDWEIKDWKKIITRDMLPNGMKEAEYAEDLRLGVELSFPTAYFLNRVVDRDFSEEIELIAKDSKNEKRIAFNNTFKYLIKDDDNNLLGEKETKKRLDYFKDFNKNNPAINLLQADFMKLSDEFDWKGIRGDKNKKSILAQMRAFQRVHILGDSQKVREGLLKSGFDTARKITDTPYDVIITKLQKQGSSIAEARNVYKVARNMTAHSAHLVEAMRTGIHGGFNSLGFSNTKPDSYNDLKEIEGYEELFGEQDFCACAHCRSIFSPAAYFSDLMRFVEKHASSKLKTNSQIQLSKRRPDLWTLPLTCENTNKEIPYLQVVNGVLETFISTNNPGKDPYELIAESHTSTLLARNLPLEEVRVLLGHFDMTLYDLYKLLGVEKEKQLQEKLQLSATELDVITGEHDDKILQRFGDKTVAQLKEFEVQEFIEYARIGRKELDELLATSAWAIIQKIKVIRKEDKSDIQKFSEKLEGLTKENLALVHRYLSLWRKTGWTLSEFSFVLKTIPPRFSIPSKIINKTEVLFLAEMLMIQERLDLTVEQLVVMRSNIPSVSIKENQQSLSERLFSEEKVKLTRNTLTIGGTVNLNLKLYEKEIPRLLSGLGINESDLTILADFFNIKESPTINEISLSKFYRYVLVARGLDWSIQELVYACQLLNSGVELKDSLDDYFKLFELADWLEESPFSMEDLWFLIKNKTPNGYFTDYDKESPKAIIKNILEATPFPDFANEKPKLTEAKIKTEKNKIKRARNTMLPIEMQGIFDFKTTEIFDETKKQELEKAALVYQRLGLSETAILFLIDNKKVFDIQSLKNWNLKDLETLSQYHHLLKDIEEELFNKALKAFKNNTFNDVSLAALVKNWEQPLSRLSSLQSLLSGTAIDAASKLKLLSDLSALLNLNGNQLSIIRSNDGTFKKLIIVKNIILAAFTSKYTDEAERNEKLEPYIDKINTLKRDALTDFIMGIGKYKFKDLNDLYAHFLLDVEMSGCFRTSKIRAAISSLQFYVHRCISNLEQSKSKPITKVEFSAEAKQEWEWRKNYRVWEANRKVFLYPENYVEPDLRDNKSHLFKELEEELLQEDVSLETAEAAYKKYMAGFVELAKLRYAGAYYHRVTEPVIFNLGKMASLKEEVYYSHIPKPNAIPIFSNPNKPPLGESEDSLYYLFARTHTDPYQYFYRTYNHYKDIWSNWMKMEVAIEAEEISALIYMGKLYVFWTEVQRNEMTKFVEGTSSSDGVIFKVFTKYAFLKEDGQWSTPQKVYLGFKTIEERVIFLRGLGSYPNNPQEKEGRKIIEKKKDEAYREFEKKIFRKPYVALSNNDSYQLKILQIWSQYKELTQKDYTVKAKKYKFSAWTKKNVGFIEIFFETPKLNFEINNDDFSDARKTKKGKVIFYLNGRIDTQQDIDFIFHLYSPSHCTVQLVESKIIYYNLPVDADDIPSEISASEFHLSLPKNEVLDNHDIDINSNNLNSPDFFPLIKEYDVAFVENGNYEHFVENGSVNFTAFDKRVTQLEIDEAFLFLPNNLKTILLTTKLTDELSEILYLQGIETFLSSETQNLVNKNGQDFKNDSYKAYYWELFFHIPFLIANHLNANQKFKEAEWWYQRIFNPTNASDDKDSYWEFSRFKNLGIETLKEIITDEEAIETYKEDPFDPHAIARLRPNAYQKAIVMKYIDNLTDWGDYLFTRDTRESIGEAMQKYILAKDILGKRPVQLGKCETADTKKLNYKELIFESDFLVNIENYIWRVRQEMEFVVKPNRASKFLKPLSSDNRVLGLNEIIKNVKNSYGSIELYDKIDETLINPGTSLRLNNRSLSKYSERANVKAISAVSVGPWIANTPIKETEIIRPARKPIFILDWILEKELAFCIPNNQDLIGYWDRVGDRMHKVRHCMNISGVQRSLALYEPPIDPALFVRAMAAGLSLQDIKNDLLGAAPQPHYRFSYLIEKARQYTQVVQGFGNALLSALEKKDGEELALLRSVHEQNILRMTRRIKLQQVKESQVAMKNTEETIRNVENRLSYYSSLIDTGLLSEEILQENLTQRADIGIQNTAMIRLQASYLRLIAQLGAPTSMNYGGEELGQSLSLVADFVSANASSLQIKSAELGNRAGKKRREQDWEFQKRTAEIELKGIEQQLIMSEIRIQIAEKDLEIHERQMEQAKELNDFYKGKFTNLGLYDFMASNLNRLYRQAYNMAYDMAKQTEKAYQLEQNQQEQFFVEGNNWDAGKAGLVAGDRLLIQLMDLEKSYMEANTRRQEITQTFSVLQLQPEALIRLRQEGACTFKIPPIAFEMFYPGQYKRLIKSVRVTIPSVVGPYTNVSAKLSLVKSEIEMTNGTEIAPRFIAKDQSISLSGALNDAGVFELNYRDERYLPFEEAGAISTWKLGLPKTFRAFNYDTISDVLMTISYTAIEGNREQAENNLKQAFENYTKDSGLFRLISLKHEFPNEFHQLLNPNNGDSQKTEFELNQLHFPYLLQGKNLKLTETKIYVKPSTDSSVSLPNSFKINTKKVKWEVGNDISHTSSDGEVNNMKGGIVSLTGNKLPLGKWELDAGVNGFDKSVVEDVLILIEYQTD